MSKRLVGADGTVWECVAKSSREASAAAGQPPGETVTTYACRRADEPKSEARYISVSSTLDLDDPEVAKRVAPTIP